MKPTFLLLSILLLAGSGQAQSPRPKPTAQPEVPKSKFVMTAPRPATTSAHSGSRRSGGSHRSRSSFFYPTSPILLTDDTSNSGSADGYGYSPQGAVTTAADFSASGDSSWEPSTYMDYDAALALGKQLQAASAQPDVSSISLGEIARNYRAAKAKADAAAKPQS